MIATWWLCNASLSTLMDDKRNRKAILLLGLFLSIGLGSLAAISRVYNILLGKFLEFAPAMYIEVFDTLGDRFVGAMLGVFVGGLIFVTVNKLQVWFTAKS